MPLPESQSAMSSHKLTLFDREFNPSEPVNLSEPNLGPVSEPGFGPSKPVKWLGELGSADTVPWYAEAILCLPSPFRTTADQ